VTSIEGEGRVGRGALDRGSESGATEAVARAWVTEERDGGDGEGEESSDAAAIDDR